MDWRARNAAYWANGATSQETGKLAAPGTYIAPSVSAGHVGAVNNPDEVFGANYTHQGFTVPYAQTAAGQAASAAQARADAAEDAKRRANEASRGNTQKAIDSLDTEQNTLYRNIDDEYGSINSKYDNERTRNRGEFEENGVTNNQNLLKDKMAAILAATQGRRGLRGVLGSMNALSGDGLKLADRAVTTEANSDLGAAGDTFGANAQQNDKAWKNFDEEDKDRRAELKTQRSNQRTAAEGKVLSKRQSLFEKMADLWGDMGDGDNASKWLNKSGDLNDSIARSAQVKSTPFSKRAAAFTPGSLQEYLAGAGDMTVESQAGGLDGAGAEGNSLLFGGRKRDREKTAA